MPNPVRNTRRKDSNFFHNSGKKKPTGKKKDHIHAILENFLWKINKWNQVDSGIAPPHIIEAGKSCNVENKNQAGRK